MLRMLPFLFAAVAAAAASGGPVTINDDGGWCWFEDERVLVDRGRIVAASVASGYRDAARKGSIEVAVFDPATGQRSVSVLHRPDSPAEQRAWLDDHNSPALLVRPDGRFIAMYAKHGSEPKIYYRISRQPHDATSWQDERVFVPSPSSRVTYSNLHFLARENNGKGRIYDFFRGLDNSFKPSWAWSDDAGETWTAGSVFINVPTQFRHRPYVKYASNGTDAVHVAYTEGHPRNFDNSIYHIVYRAGNVCRSDGTVIRGLKEGLKAPEEGTRVFAGNADNVAWISDMALDAQGRPYLVFSVQKDGAGKGPGEGGEDFRYHYARWNGTAWSQHEIAYAGSKLYRNEDDYTGNIAVDPHEPNTVYISSNADPSSGKRLPHWEIFRGTTRDGAKWTWMPLTRDSDADNIRPVVPAWDARNRAVLWLRGKMRAYTDYDFSVVGLIGKR